MVADVIEIGDGQALLSVSAFCTEAMTKEETISRRLKVAKLEPVKTKGRAKLYRLSDLIRCAYLIDDDGQPNPAGMDPFKRKAHFQAQQEEVRYLQDCSELIPKIQMQEELARAAKIFTQGLDTLPDVLERACGLAPAQVQTAVDHCNKHRDEIAEILAAEDDAATDKSPVRQSA